MTAKEIAKLEGMPSSVTGVHKKARREKWTKREQEGVQGRGVEYLIQLPPEASSPDCLERDSFSKRLTDVLEGKNQEQINEDSQCLEARNELNLPVDLRQLELSIEAVELLCEDQGFRLDIERKARAIALIYTISIKQESVDKSVIYQILKLAS